MYWATFSEQKTLKELTQISVECHLKAHRNGTLLWAHICFFSKMPCLQIANFLCQTLAQGAPECTSSSGGMKACDVVLQDFN